VSLSNIIGSERDNVFMVPAHPGSPWYRAVKWVVIAVTTTTCASDLLNEKIVQHGTANNYYALHAKSAEYAPTIFYQRHIYYCYSLTILTRDVRWIVQFVRRTA